MTLLNKLTIKNLVLNKKRTVVTIIGIMLSVALITAVATMYSSCIASLIKFETYEKGDFHVAFYGVLVDEISILKNNRKIQDVFLTQNIGYAKLENSKNKYKPYAFIKGFTKKSLENLSVKIVEGRLPENSDEVIIPTHLKTNGRITLNVGDMITLNVGKRVSEGYELNQSNPYNEEDSEEIVDAISKTYKIVGIIERPASNIEDYSSPGYTFATLINEEEIVGKVDAFCKYTKDGTKDYIGVTANILQINKDALEKFEYGEFDYEEFSKISNEISKAIYNYNINSYLITLENNPLDERAVGGLGTVVIIVCGIIVFTSIFCIKNSFDISITEKTKQYGMLKSIGATKKQIRKNVFFEATILGIIGIPLGLVLGIFASWILIIISNYFIGDMFARGLKLILSFSYEAFIVAILLGIITIYLSSLRSAYKASKTSPIDSIRNSSGIKIKAKKIESPKLISKIFGIGGTISYKNLKRNRKKYRTTVISIAVSVSVFIALSYFISLASNEVRNELSLRDYNISISINDRVDEQLYKKIYKTTELENIKEYTFLKYDSCYIENPKYSDKYKEYMIRVNGEEDNNIFDGYIKVMTINDEQYKKYIKKLGLDYQQVKDKAILVDNTTLGIYDENKGKTIVKKVNSFEYSKDEILNCTTNKGDNFATQVCITTDVLPFGIDNHYECFIIISNELYEKYFRNYNIGVYYDSSNPDKLQDDIDDVLKGYNYNLNNVEQNTRMMEKLYTLIGIFLYGFITVITLIGITNIFNTITTNMELRKPEFAMLKSIGMTTKEFNKMIRLETLFMGLKSLIFSVPIGIVLSYLLYRSFSLGEIQDVSFELPIKAILIAIVIVFLLITCIMKYSIRKINKQNTIETIRNENI